MVRGLQREVAVLGAILSLTGCRSDDAPRPVSRELYASSLQVRAHCSVYFELELGSELDLDEGLVLPNLDCKDHTDLEEAHPLLGIPPSSPDVVVLSIRNPRTTPITLTSIALETDSPSGRPLDELIGFRERYDECLDWLSDPPLAGITTWLAPKTLQPGETCYAELGLIEPSAAGASLATGSVVFLGPAAAELARLPVSVDY